MNVHLVPINKHNWEIAAKLQVRDDQKEFVAENVWSIAETQFYPWTQATAIYEGRTMVGFLVYGRDPEDNQFWLYRFMIDRGHQGKGIGRAALRALLEELRELPDFDGITVGYQRNNVMAERLYLSEGFVKGPPAPWGEATARYTAALSERAE